MRCVTNAILTLCATGLIGTAAAQDVRNEGTGQRRTNLDRMVFGPAPMATVLGASEWHGTAPTAADLNGNSVLIFTFSEWYRPSHSAAMVAKRLASAFADDGLVVIGVHDSEGWDEAVRFADQRKLGFPIVRDTDGSIRRAFMVDQDPDAYVIDRSGNLRYADITTDSITRAVELVMAEDIAQATDAESSLARRRAQARADARRSGSINQRASLENLPTIPFSPPSAEVYAATNWPKHDEELLENASSIDELTPPLVIPDGEWLNGKPETAGKIVVAYVWHPVDRDVTNILMARMDDLHKQMGRDVAVIGYFVPAVDDRRRGRNNGGLIIDEFRDIPITMEGMTQSIGSRQISHHIYVSPSGQAIPQVGNQRRRSNNDSGFIGQIVIASSDGRVRRSAHWRQWDEVQQAIDHLLREDPGVQARRQAEARYIRGNGG